jgi:hypothetical protein
MCAAAPDRLGQRAGGRIVQHDQVARVHLVSDQPLGLLGSLEVDLARLWAEPRRRVQLASQHLVESLDQPPQRFRHRHPCATRGHAIRTDAAQASL